MKSKFIFFTLLLESLLFIRYDLPSYCFIAYILTIIEAMFFLWNNRYMAVANWWLYIYMVCTFVVIPVFKFTPSHFTLSCSVINDGSFLHLAMISPIVMCLYFFALLLFCEKGKKTELPTQFTIYAPNFNLKIIFILAFTATILSYIVGIGKMGVVNTRLPFHLSGVIQFFRTTMIPIFALFIYVHNKNNDRNNKVLIGLLFVWSLAEVYVRMSKSAMIMIFLPLLIYELMYYGKNFKGVIVKFLPILAVVLILYPIVETFRHSDSLRDAISAADEEEIVGTYTNPSSKNYIVKPFNRRFLTGYLYLVDENVCSNSFFDFSRAAAILAIKGSARYQTFVVDGYPIGVAHSSGTTPFIDGLLVGGYGLMYLAVFIMTYLARVIDKKFRKKTNYLIVTMLLMLYYYWFDGPLYTFFLNEMSIRTVIVYGALIFYIHFMWKKTKINILR